MLAHVVCPQIDTLEVDRAENGVTPGAAAASKAAVRSIKLANGDLSVFCRMLCTIF